MEPAAVPFVDEQIAGDVWSVKIKLPTSKDWSVSTFTVTAIAEGDLEIAVDDSHKADTEPYIVMSLTADQVVSGSFHWNLTETPVLARTFLTGKVLVRQR